MKTRRLTTGAERARRRLLNQDSFIQPLFPLVTRSLSCPSSRPPSAPRSRPPPPSLSSRRRARGAGRSSRRRSPPSARRSRSCPRRPAPAPSPPPPRCTPNVGVELKGVS
eukprot:16991-Pelagococcus_subviridis.AAC.2